MPINVMTTHVHWDHTGCHRKYERIYVHEAEKEWLAKGLKGLPIEQMRKDIARDIAKPVPETFYTPYKGEPTDVLTDGDMIEIGSRPLVIYHTPGHSPSHICIFDSANGYLFTGDLFYTGAPNMLSTRRQIRPMQAIPLRKSQRYSLSAKFLEDIISSGLPPPS
ncbi:hypothetical protein J41TS2_41500 [Bacillus sonorensis]|nr:hypothetical protein J41TS2_41500 [Bacillus sonorensis]